MNTIKKIVAIASTIITTLCAINLTGCAGQTFAPSLRDASSVTAEPTAETHEVEVMATGEIRMVVQIDGRDVVLPVGWNIDIDTDELLVLGHADGRTIELARSEDAHGDLMAIVAEQDSPAVCTGRNCRVDFVECDGEIEATNDGLIFHTAPAHRVSAWTQGERVVTVSVPSESPNQQTAILLANDLAR